MSQAEEMMARIRRRVAMMSPSDLMSWADTATYGIQRHLDDFRRTQDPANLAEIRLAAITMEAMCDALEKSLN